MELGLKHDASLRFAWSHCAWKHNVNLLHPSEQLARPLPHHETATQPHDTPAVARPVLSLGEGKTSV